MYVHKKSDAGQEPGSPAAASEAKTSSQKHMASQPALERLSIRSMPPEMRGYAFGDMPSEQQAREGQLTNLANNYNELAQGLGMPADATPGNVMERVVAGLQVSAEELERRRAAIEVRGADIGDQPSRKLDELDNKQQNLYWELRVVIASMAKMDASHEKRKAKALGTEQEIAATQSDNARLFSELDGLDGLRRNNELLAMEIGSLEAKRDRLKGQFPALKEQLPGLESRLKELRSDQEESRNCLQEALKLLSKVDAARTQSAATFKAERKEVKAKRKTATEERLDAVQKSYYPMKEEIDADLEALGDVYGKAIDLLVRRADVGQRLYKAMVGETEDREMALERVDLEREDVKSRIVAVDAEIGKLSARETALRQQILAAKGNSGYFGKLKEISNLRRENKELAAQIPAPSEEGG
jgi:predicted  nucleic acid-binding Zn-ribbon protein